MARAIDIVQVKREIQAGKLAVEFKDSDVLLTDKQSGEAVCIATLTPPNEWVSVEERLPPLRENVLVCAYWHEHWGVYIGWNSGHGWTVSCGIGQRSDVQVSHWMPLPAPPDRRPPEGEADA